MFYRDFRRPNRAKVKSIFEIEWQKVGKLWAAVAASPGGSLGLFQALSGALEGFRSGSPASLQIRAFWLSLCNRFPSLLLNFRFKGILRAFVWVYRLRMYVRLACGFRGACGTLCVYC